MKLKSSNHGTLKNLGIGQPKKIVALAASLVLLQLSLAPYAFAQDKSAPASLNNSTNPDNWPWMQVNPDGVQSKGHPATPADASSTPPSTPAATGTPATSPSSGASAFPDMLTNPVGAVTDKQDKQESKPAEKPKFESERAKVDVESKPQEQRHEFKEEHATAVQERPKATTHTLFGRIEELSSGVGAKFPVLRAQKAQMDLTGSGMLKADAVDSIYSGQAVRSFPATMNGNWGGILQLSLIQLDPLYYQLDADEAKQTSDLMRPGLQGKVNFVFENSARGVALEPAEILFSAPMTEARLASSMSHAGGGLPGMGSMNMASMPGMEGMMKSMMMSMPYMWKMFFGATSGTGLSGNTLQTTLIKNEVRQLSPTVIEEQIISREFDTNPKTGRQRSSYSESVIRFTRYNASQQYVQAAAVDYNSDKRFLRKMVFAGYVTKGVVEQTNPMAALSGMGGLGGLGAGAAGGAGGMGGMGGLGDLQKLFQGGGLGGAGGTGPQIPNLKGLFGQ